MITNKDLMRAHASMKSYTGSAILVFFLYLIFYPVGLIANILYYLDAKRMEQIAGIGLSGAGSLTLMLWLNAAMIALVFLIMILGTIPFLLNSH